MMVFASRRALANASLAGVSLLAVLTACTSPPPPSPTAQTEAKPTAAAAVAASPTAAAPAPSPVASPAPAAAPVAAASPPAVPSPAAAAPPSPPAVASPAGSPVAAAPPAPTPTLAPPPVVGASSAAGRIAAVHTLPDTPIGAFQNATLPGSIPNDRKMLLGGIGSDLWHAPGDAPDEFWAITDRGPNGQVPVNLIQRRTFPIPEFNPAILKIRAAGGTIAILETIPIVGQSGKPVTGLSNLDVKDEPPYDDRAETLLPYNVNGLDTEGLVRLKNGEFWVAEEYSPSILRIDPSGKVVKRYLPQSLELPGADYPIVEALPAVYGKRKINRGFEGLALSPDERTLFIILQSPLLNPDTATGNPSRMCRILVFDIATEKVTAEYVYRLEAVGDFDLTANRPATEMKLSAAIGLSADSLLVLERTDWAAKIYRVELPQATNILGSKWDDSAILPTLEASNNPAAIGVEVLPKSLVIDLQEIPGIPDKIEGIALVNPTTLVIANDNDFDISTFDAAGNHQGPGAQSRLLFIILTTPLPMQ